MGTCLMGGLVVSTAQAAQVVYYQIDAVAARRTPEQSSLDTQRGTSATETPITPRLSLLPLCSLPDLLRHNLP